MQMLSDWMSYVNEILILIRNLFGVNGKKMKMISIDGNCEWLEWMASGFVLLRMVTHDCAGGAGMGRSGMEGSREDSLDEAFEM